MKKRLLSVLLAVAMVATLTACGAKEEAAAPAAAPAAKEEAAAPAEAAPAAEATEEAAAIEPCTIKFTYWADNTDYSALMQEIISKFNAENEYGIEVVGEELPWDGGGFSTNLFNTAMGGGAPDVATFKLTATPMFANNDLLADLTPFVDSWDNKADISDNLYGVMKNAGGSDTAMYVMPWNTQILYVYYRPSIFEKAGVEVPTTYDELLAAIEKCTMDTDGDGTYTKETYQSMVDLTAWLAQNDPDEYVKEAFNFGLLYKYGNEK